MTIGVPLNVAVTEPDHFWHKPIVETVERAGARVSSIEDAEAMVWVAKHEADLRDVLHDGIKWVQIPHAGVEKWVRSGEVDDKRMFTSIRGGYARNVGEHVIALLLAGARRLHVCARLTAWDEPHGEGRLFQGSTVAIVGAGGIGEEVVHLLAPFGVKIIAVNRSGREVPGANVTLPASRVAEVWPQADYVVVIAPSTPETDAMINREVLQAMPDHAFLVNVSRGKLVDTDALVEALREGWIAGAALDVTDPEPLPAGHPLWDLETALITPHVANPNSVNVARMQERIIENIRRFTKGEELVGLIDLERGY